ncbi:MAG: MarR family transcriptional regulator [Pseudomonadota bacterium]
MVQAKRPLGTRLRAQREQSALLLARTLVDRTHSLYRELEQRTGAPVQAHRALARVAADPGIQSSQLASSLGMQRSAVSHLLRTLSDQGWIDRSRSGGDQRSVHLFVTAAGNGILGATTGRMVGVLQHAVEQLDNTQLLELERSLDALLQHIEAPAPGMGRPTRGRRPHTAVR